MILGKSVDKVKIKKISLKVWSLTDEIDATLGSLAEMGEEALKENVPLVKAFYEAQPATEWNKKPALTLLPGGKSEEKKEEVKTEAAPAPATDAKPAEVKTEATATPPTTDAKPEEVKTEAPATTENKPAEVKTEAAPTATSAPVAPLELTMPTKKIKIEDFLNLRKDGIRTMPAKENVSEGFAILYDIDFDQILFFTEKAFKPGQQVVINFSIPRSFTICAEIISITNVHVGSKIINQQPINYRMVARFLLNHVGDKTLIRNFLVSIDQRDPASLA